jgi:hypothetical protein
MDPSGALGKASSLSGAGALLAVIADRRPIAFGWCGPGWRTNCIPLPPSPQTPRSKTACTCKHYPRRRVVPRPIPILSVASHIANCSSTAYCRHACGFGGKSDIEAVNHLLVRSYLSAIWARGYIAFDMEPTDPTLPQVRHWTIDFGYFEAPVKRNCRICNGGF